MESKKFNLLDSEDDLNILSSNRNNSSATNNYQVNQLNLGGASRLSS